MTWLLIFVGGMLGSSHCVGMCGGFVLSVGSLPMVSPTPMASGLTRQLVYAGGRVFTYAVAGALAGFGGWRLAVALRSLVNVQAALLILAGVLILVQGLVTAGVLRRVLAFSGRGPCSLAGPFAGLLRSPRLERVFVAGLLNGLIPCGLVYGYLALAVGTGDMWLGMATMAVFGLGTVPVLVLTGCGGAMLGLSSRRWLFQIASWCMVLTGALSIFRGVEVMRSQGLFQPTCPMCG